MTINQKSSVCILTRFPQGDWDAVASEAEEQGIGGQHTARTSSIPATTPGKFFFGAHVSAHPHARPRAVHMGLSTTCDSFIHRGDREVGPM